MEFNADRVAAKTSGSESIISALWKLDYGAQNWNTSVNHLYNANAKGINIPNLYNHHEEVAEASDIKLKELLSALEDHPKGGKQFFVTDEASQVSMYASHPPNNSREENVKSPYVACELDDRSPWLLFNSKEKIQEQCTAVIYSKYFLKEINEYTNLGAFKSFVDQESKGTDLLDKYLNTYQSRYLIVDDIEPNIYESMESSDLLTQAHELIGQLPKLHEKLEAIDSKIIALNKLAEGSSKQSVVFTDKNYNKKNINEGYTHLYTAWNELLNGKFTEWDQKQYSVHRILNERLNISEDFPHLIEQHKKITFLYKNFLEKKDIIINYLTELQANDEITEDNIFSVAKNVANIGRDLNNIIVKFKIENYIPLSNIDDFEELITTIVPNKTIKTPYGNMFRNGGYNEFIQSIDYGINQLNRIDQKSIIEVLSRYEEIVAHAGWQIHLLAIQYKVWI